jgi:outer membrane protein assembly factor BamB
MEKGLMSKIRSLILGLLTLFLMIGVTILSSNNDKSLPITRPLTDITEGLDEKAIQTVYSSYFPPKQISQLPIEMWNFTVPESDVETLGLAIADINGDGGVEIVFGTYEAPRYGKVYALNGTNGNKLWDHLPIMAPVMGPALGDIDNDGKLEMLFSAYELVIAIEDDGKSDKWSTTVSSTFNDAYPTLGDIDNDSKLEVIVGGNDGVVTALEAENGDFKWNFQTNDQIRASIALGDINNDDKLEVIIGSSDGYLYALSGEYGIQLWNYSTGGRIGSNDGSADPILADLDNDQELEVVVGNEKGNVIALNADDGSLLWQHLTGNGVYCTPALGDIDNDKKLDVIIGSTDGYMYALYGENGSIIWQKKRDPYTGASLGDIDNDNRLEIIFGSSDNKLTALNGEDGSILWNMMFQNINWFPPALYDLDNDQKLEIVFSTKYDEISEEPCRVYALKPHASGYRNYWTYGASTNYSFTQNLHDIDPDMDFISSYSENITGTSISDPDTDNDNMLDGWEVSYGLDPFFNDSASDPDGDSLVNIVEYQLNINPTEDDTDGDGMPDGWEVQYGLSPRNTATPTEDTDGDDLVDILEWQEKTDPTNSDSDNDGLSDGQEVFIYKTYPLVWDSDNDEMPDGWEVIMGLDPTTWDRSGDLDGDNLTNFEEYYQYNTYPNTNDTDNDGLTDYYEVILFPELNATDPDTDNDEISDGWEVKYHLNPLDPNDARLDVDGDGLSNLQEYELFLEHGWELNPNLDDTDKDGLLDKAEVTLYNTNPADNDTDDDGVLDGKEIALGLDATNPDTDNDGDLDGDELGEFLLDPKNPLFNKKTRNLIIIGGSSSISLLILGGVSYRFLYFPRRMTIKEWWNRRVLRLYHRDEDFMKYAGKARKIAKKFNDEEDPETKPLTEY